MNKLPFKVRSTNPEIVHVTSKTDVPFVVRNDRGGSVALFYRGKIYTFRKNLPKHVIEHEKAHSQITSDKTYSPQGTVKWLNDEIAADILTYRRTGKPESITPYIMERARTIGYYHANDSHNRYETNRHILDHILRTYNKFYKYLPEQWQKDYDKFKIRAEFDLTRMRKRGQHLRPAGDFVMNIKRSGDFDVKHKRVTRRRDPVTGLYVSRVNDKSIIVR